MAIVRLDIAHIPYRYSTDIAPNLRYPHLKAAAAGVAMTTTGAPPGAVVTASAAVAMAMAGNAGVIIMWAERRTTS